jgi:hypothetical protein
MCRQDKMPKRDGPIWKKLPKVMRYVIVRATFTFIQARETGLLQGHVYNIFLYRLALRQGSERVGLHALRLESQRSAVNGLLVGELRERGETDAKPRCRTILTQRFSFHQVLTCPNHQIKAKKEHLIVSLRHSNWTSSNVVDILIDITGNYR